MVTTDDAMYSRRCPTSSGWSHQCSPDPSLPASSVAAKCNVNDNCQMSSSSSADTLTSCLVISYWNDGPSPQSNVPHWNNNMSPYPSRSVSSARSTEYQSSINSTAS